jgi:ferredoxin--NADP+ reductase
MDTNPFPWRSVADTRFRGQRRKVTATHRVTSQEFWRYHIAMIAKFTDATVRPPKIAIVGAGPSGLFAAAALVERLGDRVSVDVIDRLLTPYGLVRYGVAPDHPNIKSVVSALEVVLESEGVRFLGGVEFGRHIGVDDLRRCYDAVVYAAGAPRARRLCIPGEDLHGSVSATDLVSWYNGHPDAMDDFGVEAESVVVIGAGNVALDVGRILTRDYEDLANTDMPDRVLARLRGHPVRSVHLVARRGAEFARYSSKELRELGRVPSVDRIVHANELPARNARDFDRATKANVDLFDQWCAETARSTARKVHLRFGLQPVRIVGDGRVEEAIFERTAVGDNGAVVGTGEFISIEAQLVVRAVGYLGVELAGVPFDERTGTVPNVAGRVVTPSGGVVSREYVTGWLKRGPSGVIGTNKVDAGETIAALIEDLDNLPRPERDSIESALDGSGHQWVAFDGWQRIDRAEVARGQGQGRQRSKISDWPTLRGIAMGVRQLSSSSEGSRPL